MYTSIRGRKTRVYPVVILKRMANHTYVGSALTNAHGGQNLFFSCKKLRRVNLLFHAVLLERFSIECRKTKTKVITLANHKGHIIK